MESLSSKFLISMLLSFLALSSSSSTGVSKTVVLIDPFTEYLSGVCKEYCAVNDIRVIELVSPYLCKAIGRDFPASLLTPKEGKEINWARKVGIITSDVEKISMQERVCVFSESDSGLDAAEKLQDRIGAVGNGHSPHLRNKYLANERAKAFGLKVKFLGSFSFWKFIHVSCDGLDCSTETSFFLAGSEGVFSQQLVET